MKQSRLVNRNIVAMRGRSSMRLEPEIWEALQEICRREHLLMGDLVRRVEQEAGTSARTSAVRIYAFSYFRAAATEEGHRSAGHGSLE